MNSEVFQWYSNIFVEETDGTLKPSSKFNCQSLIMLLFVHGPAKFSEFLGNRAP
jgi:hypothetical protein